MKWIVEAESIDDIVLGRYTISDTPLIECKNCKYNATSKKCLNPDSFFLVPADDDFCSRAERREE